MAGVGSVLLPQRILEAAKPKLSRSHLLQIFVATPSLEAMKWIVQYREDGIDRLVGYPTPEEAIECACRLIDEGWDVYGLGAEQLGISIGRIEIARIHAFWVREKTPFDRTPN
jgi:hypothetical protein